MVVRTQILESFPVSVSCHFQVIQTLKGPVRQGTGICGGQKSFKKGHKVIADKDRTLWLRRVVARDG